MRFHRVSMFLACAAIAVVSAAACCCGDYGASKPALAEGIKVPGRVAHSVVRGNELIALLTDGRLVRIHLTQGDTKTLATFELPVSALDLSGNKVCVASKNRAMVVDLADGRITEAAACDHGIGTLGFLDPERVYLQSGPQIRVLDLATGKTTCDVSLGRDDPKVANRGYRVLGKSGKQLFVSVASENHAIAVFDLEKGAVADRISALEMHFASDVQHPIETQFVGDKAYVLSSRLGYGVWTEKLGVVDLKTRQYTPLKMPAKGMQQPSLAAGPDGSVLLTSLDGTFQIDAAGKRIATLVAPSESIRRGDQVLGMWRGTVLFSVGQELRLVPMPVVNAQSQ